MKKLTKLAIVAALALFCSAAANAQKFGVIDLTQVIMAMPERDSVSTKLAEYEQDVYSNLEQIQVEYNNKYQDYEANRATWSQSVLELKGKELTDLQVRFQEYQEQSQNEGVVLQQSLMVPIYEKAQAAIATVAKAGNFTMIFESSSGVAYFDPATVTDVMSQVKAELGIQ